MWWDVTSGRVLVAFFEHAKPYIEVDLEHTTLCCWPVPPAIEDELVARISELVLGRYTIDRPLGINLLNPKSGGATNAAPVPVPAGGGGAASERPAAPPRSDVDIAADAWLSLESEHAK